MLCVCVCKAVTKEIIKKFAIEEKKNSNKKMVVLCI